MHIHDHNNTEKFQLEFRSTQGLTQSNVYAEYNGIGKKLFSKSMKFYENGRMLVVAIEWNY